MRLIGAAKQLISSVQHVYFDTYLELVTVTSAGRDSNGDPLPPTVSVIWEGYAALHPNLPRYERSAVSQPVLGVEERRVVYYAYLPFEAPVRTSGVMVRYDGRVYEPIKEPLPVGGEPNPYWRLDVGSPL